MENPNSFREEPSKEVGTGFECGISIKILWILKKKM